MKKLLRTILAFSIIGASCLKIFSFSQFIIDIQNFNILPIDATFPFAIIVITTELIAGSALLFNVYTNISSSILIYLLSLFTIAIVINLFQANTIHCGCFGEFLPDTINAWTVVRNIALIAVLFWIKISLKSEKYI